MGQKTMLEALRYAVDVSAGITSKRLFELTKEWAPKGTEIDEQFTLEFENCLDVLLGEGRRCTNKTWYCRGAKIVKKPRTVKTDDRQYGFKW